MKNLAVVFLILTLLFSFSLPGYSQFSVSIVSPREGETVSGVVTVKVEVSDPSKVSRVEFYINDDKLGEDTESPYEYDLDTTLIPNGRYKIRVRVYEKTGTVSGIAVNINIENQDQQKGWEKTYGGRKDDLAYSIQQTNDGGYIVAGYTWSFGSGGRDFYIIKLDKDGNTGPSPIK